MLFSQIFLLLPLGVFTNQIWPQIKIKAPKNFHRRFPREVEDNLNGNDEDFLLNYWPIKLDDALPEILRDEDVGAAQPHVTIVKQKIINHSHHGGFHNTPPVFPVHGHGHGHGFAGPQHHFPSSHHETFQAHSGFSHNQFSHVPQHGVHSALSHGGGFIHNQASHFGKKESPLIDVRGGFSPNAASNSHILNSNNQGAKHAGEILGHENDMESSIGEEPPMEFVNENDTPPQMFSADIPPEKTEEDNESPPQSDAVQEEQQDGELPPPTRFETDTGSQVFDPFDEREHVMEFLEHHEERQAPSNQMSFEENKGGAHRYAAPEPHHKHKGDYGYGYPMSYYPSQSYYGKQKKLKKIKKHKLYQPHSYYPGQYHQYHSGYVGAEFESSTEQLNSGENGEEPLQPTTQAGDDELHGTVRSPYLFDVPKRRFEEEKWRRKRSENCTNNDEELKKIQEVLKNTTLEQMIEIINDLSHKLLTELMEHNGTTLFDDDEKQNLAIEFKERLKRSTKTHEELKQDLAKIKKSISRSNDSVKNKRVPKKYLRNSKLDQRRTRQSDSLAHLISDPNSKMDVPKTVRKMGIVSSSVMADQNAPVHHMRNFLGSSRDALLSSLRIPTQANLVPSGYKIVRSDGSDDLDEFDDMDDFGGEMVRSTIRHGTDTFSHIGDMAHNAKNMVHTSPKMAQRVLVPYSRAVTLQKQPSLSSRVDSGLNEIFTRNDKKNKERNIVDTLEDAKLSVGAKSFRDFLVKMKHQFGRAILGHPRKVNKGKSNDELMDYFLEDLFDKKEHINKEREAEDYPYNSLNEEETVGFNLPEQLYHPFMGRASNQQLKDLLRENNNEDVVGMSNRNAEPSSKPGSTTLTVSNDVLTDFIEFLRTKNQTPRQHEDLGYVLGAINPIMFERNFNQTLEIRNSTDPQTFFANNERGERKGEGNETVGTFMTLTGPELKPFMGEAQPEQIEDLMETYNDTENDSLEAIDQ